MRGHIGSHSDGNAGRAVEQEKRHLRREHGRLGNGVIEVQLEINGILVEVAKNVLGDFLKLGLCVSHSCHRVAVHRTEVTLAENERISLVPVLGKTGKGIIYAGVAVRVELTQYVSHNSRRFLGLSGVAQSETVHSEENSSLNRLESVTDIRKRTGYDDRHRIIDICGPHLVVDFHRFYYAKKLFVIIIQFFCHKCVSANISFIFADSLPADYQTIAS